MKLILILLAFLLPSAALAQNQVALTSEVFVERATQDANGQPRVSLEPPGSGHAGRPTRVRAQLPQQRRGAGERLHRHQPDSRLG